MPSTKCSPGYWRTHASAQWGFESAGDVVQHAFMALCDQSPEKIGDNPAPWLFRVCRNKALDFQRRKKRDLKVMESEFANQMKTVDSNKPDKKLSDSEMFQLIQNTISLLPAAQREAIDLWSHGFSYAEIANITSKKTGAIRVSVHRAIARIKSHPSIACWLDDVKLAAVAVGENDEQ